MQTGQSDNGAVSRVAMIPIEFEIFDPSLDIYRENIEAINLFQFISEFLDGNRYGELFFFYFNANFPDRDRTKSNAVGVRDRLCCGSR